MAKKILIVEDYPDQIELIQRAFQKQKSLDFEVEFAFTGEDCIRKYSSETFDALILDYKLPDYSGLEIFQKLKQIGISVPVIIVTGQGDERVAVQAMKEGASDYIVKDLGYMNSLPKTVKNTINTYRLKEKLREKEEFLEKLVNNVDDIIFSIDMNYRFTYINQTIRELGYDPAELIGNSFLMLLPEFTDTQKVSECLQNPVEKNYELQFKAKNGKIQYMLISFSHLKDKKEKLILGIAKNITEKKKLEEMIQESKNKLQTLFDSITDYITVVDKNYEIVMANRMVAKSVGEPPEKIIGKKCYEVYAEESEPCVDCVLQKTVQSNRPEFLEKKIGEKVFQFWSYPMFDLKGRLPYVIEYAKDVTRQKRLEKKLIQSEKLATIGLLASGVAHELRNPLNIIETARYYLSEILPNENDDAKNKLMIIKRSVTRASNIINNLLEFSRHSSKDKERIDVNYLIDKTLSLIEKDLYANNISVIKNYENVPMTYFNVDSLKQVFLNIIINAIQAMPDGGQLFILTDKTPEGRLRIQFTDSGQGISDENLNQIFAPFFTTKEVGKGTGLGMYVSHSIIHGEGGEISVKSQLGRGTTFTIEVPIVEEKSNVKQEAGKLR
ncbi:sporulation kinase E [bacterium BMS3Abin05]|nr:sporulation kinase E [bacterium BMS3Abin05]